MDNFGKIAFFDEFGTNSFDFEKPNISTHFIISCVLVNKKSLKETANKLEIIRKSHFQTGEIKSSGVGDNDKRRLRILNEIAQIDFQVLGLVVDKEKLIGEGFGYKPSFYKFLNKLVYNDLRKIFLNVDIIMDETGSEKFMSGFIQYLRKEDPPDLFTPYNEIKFENSKQNIFIQLADFIAGTLARAHDRKKRSEYGPNFLQVLRKRIDYVKFFPSSFDRFTVEYNFQDTRIEQQIADLSLRLASNFIDINDGSSDAIIQLQLKTMRLLRLHRQTITHARYLSTKEILEHLNYDRLETVKQQFFRRNVIAKLRDKEILIASSKTGYKLPISKADLYDYINHDNTVILPMISRLRKCVELIKLGTNIDLLEKEEYKELNKLLNYNNG